MPLCMLPFSVMPFSADTSMTVAFSVFLPFNVVLFFTNFDSVSFRFDFTLFTFGLLNTIRDIPPYYSPYYTFTSDLHCSFLLLSSQFISFILTYLHLVSFN